MPSKNDRGPALRHSAQDVVRTAITILDEYGLADLSMRRLAAALNVQPSALYWHFTNKQTLLAAMADEILARSPGSDLAARPWDIQVTERARTLRTTLLAHRDGAELVSTVHAFGLGGTAAHQDLTGAVAAGGFPPGFAPAAAMTILHFVFGHVSVEQQHLQASSAGAIPAAGPTSETSPGPEPAGPGDPGSFEFGLALIVDGIRQRHPNP